MIRFSLSSATRQVLQMLHRQASAFGDVRVVGWINAIRLVGQGYSIPEVSGLLNMGEHLWKRVKKAATHLRYFPCFDDLVASVDGTLREMARKPQELFPLVERYASSLLVA